MVAENHLVGAFTQFAMRLQKNTASEPLTEDEQCCLRQIIQKTVEVLDDGGVCLDLSAVSTIENVTDTEALLLKSGLASREMAPQALFVIDSTHRLYLQRFYDYEVRVAARLKTMVTEATALDIDADFLAQHFPHRTPGRTFNEQALAVAVAQMSPLTVISGGPGTGKTWTAVKILEALLKKDPSLRIAMCAPTGKAAARMSESVRKALTNLDPAVRACIPTAAQTVHRLKKEGSCLPYDVVVLDEASMVSLSLLAQLVAVLPPHVRLICLGDKDQLASVEPGAVFAELSERFEFSARGVERLNALGFDVSELPSGPARSHEQWNLIDHTVWLTRSHRFDDQKGIGLLAHSIRENQPQKALETLSQTGGLVRWVSLPAEATTLPMSVKEGLIELYRPYFDAVLAYQSGCGNLESIFSALHRNGVLCALNEGPFGVSTLNGWIVENYGDGHVEASSHFCGEVIMVSVNDNDLELNNGDVGVVLSQAEGFCAYFESVDAHGEPFYRAIPVGRLPDYRRAFAITIHKSQGSEYDHVLTVLPPKSPLLTRELLYTAVTRAKNSLVVVAGADSVIQAIESPTVRLSGLLLR